MSDNGELDAFEVVSLHRYGAGVALGCIGRRRDGTFVAFLLKGGLPGALEESYASEPAAREALAALPDRVRATA